MRSWRVHELGEPADVMRLEVVPDPEPRPGDVLLDVEAVGLNFPDLLQVRGGYQVKPDLPFTPGGEVVGVVRSVGEGVDAARVGERVLIMAPGGLAERAAGPAAKAFPLPAAMPSTKAAALLSNYGTAWFALH